MSGYFGTLIRHHVTPVWLLLVMATCLSWWMGNDNGRLNLDVRYISSGLLIVAFVKVRFVMRFFMEVRAAAFVLKALVDLWVTLVCSALLLLYWFG